jgi:hypothetical protein
MAQIPRTQADITSLADSMIAGFTAHPADFPHADVPSLQNARDAFLQASNTLTDAEAAAALAAERKQEKLQQLEFVLKKNIKMASADCSSNPEKLTELGWSPRREAQSIAPPAQPTDLKTVAQTEDTLFLSWRKPPRNTGGPARTYIVERRQFTENLWNDWQLAATSFNSETKLENQPTGCKLEYRVKTINSSGESMPSNTISVVL